MDIQSLSERKAGRTGEIFKTPLCAASSYSPSSSSSTAGKVSRAGQSGRSVGQISREGQSGRSVGQQALIFSAIEVLPAGKGEGWGGVAVVNPREYA